MNVTTELIAGAWDRWTPLEINEEAILLVEDAVSNEIVRAGRYGQDSHIHMGKKICLIECV